MLKARSKPVAALCLLALGLAFSGIAANPEAGLEPVPKWTKTAQLKEKWGKVSLSELRAKAEAGDPGAQHYLGWRYANGEGVGQDARAAAEWYRKAAEQGFALAQNNLGASYNAGNGVVKDVSEAGRWYRRAADQGLPVALGNLGDLARQGASPDLKPEDCLRYYELAAERGDCRAAVALGRLHIWDALPGSTLDEELGAYWLHMAAKNGCVEAYANVGWLYLEGRGVPGDYKEARRWFNKGAEQEEPYCYLGLAMAELTDETAAPDLAKAKDWLLKAGEKNVPRAFFQLGRLSELRNIRHGPAAKPDYNEAVKWYQRAADAGNSAAAGRLAELAEEGKTGSGDSLVARLQAASDLGNLEARLSLARLYLRGEGKPRNADDEPVQLLESLVRAGDPLAKLEMADLCRTGQHVPKDAVKALYLIHRAVLAGEGNAAERLEDLKEARRQGRPVAPFNRGLEEVYPLYFEGLFNNQSAVSASRIARNYLNGAYPTNKVAAYAWFSLAVRRNDSEARAERDGLLQKFDASEKKDALEMAQGLYNCSCFDLP